MDKNKSRSDLLAAGRKKLQQYRKKKDNKGGGSHGSSSKNTSKFEQNDADVDTVTVGVLASAVDCGADTVDSSASPSTEHSLEAEVDHSTSSVKQEMDLVETSAIDQAEVPFQEVGFRKDYDHPIQNAEDTGIISFGPSLATDAEESNNDIHNLSNTEYSSQISSSSVEQQEGIVDVSGGSREEGLIPPQFASLLQAREDVGTKEDASVQSGQLCETELSEDKQLKIGGMNELAAETTFKDKCCDEEEIITEDMASVSGAASESNSYTISSPGEKLGMQNSYSSGRDDWKGERQVCAEDMVHSSRSQMQYMPEDNFTDKPDGHEGHSQKSLKMSDGGGVDNISHNAHMATTFDAQSGTFSSFGKDSKFLDLLDRVKEELIVTSFSKDIFNLQLSEQNELQMELDNQRSKLTNDMSLLNTSLSEVLERNHGLVDELLHCRSELKDVSFAKEELRNQLLTAEDEMQKLSSRASETGNSLEKLQGDMFRMGNELGDCKHLVTVLEEEKERLNGIITLENENKRKLAEEKELYISENEKISSELSSFKSLQAVLEGENSKLVASLSSIAEEQTKLEEEREHLSQVNGTLSVELSNCKNLVATQQEEITNLIKNLALVTEDRAKLEEDKNLLFHENEKMTSELLVLDERLSTEHEERVRIEDDLKDALVQLDQLTDENVFLSNSLDIHKFKIEELCGEISSLQTRSREDKDQAEREDSGSHHGNKSQENDSYKITLKKCLPETSVLAAEKPFIVTEHENFDDSLEFLTLGRHLEEADLILLKLEKEIKRLQSSSSSSSTSDTKMVAPAVSKLIQAFESKVNVEENEVEAEIQLSDDSDKLSNELVDNLRVLLRQVVVDCKNGSALLKGERDQQNVAISTLNELKNQFEALENHSNDLVIANIQHVVLFECLKHHVDDTDVKIYELESLNESLKQQGVHHKNSNAELAVRLCGYELKLTELEHQLCDLHQSSNQMVSLICNQLDNLQDGAIERAMILEKDWHSFLLELTESIAKLDESLGKSDTSAIKFCTNDQLSSCISVSVTDAVQMIDDLRERLQATATDGEAFRMLHEEVNEKYDNLFRRMEFSVDMLHKIYGELQKLHIASYGSVDGSDLNLQIKTQGDPLDYSSFEALIKPLEDCITEKLQLESVNNKLRLDLEHRTVEFVEFSKRCLDSIGIEKLIKDVQSVLILEDTDEDRVEMPALYLESMVSLLLHKYKETELQLGLSREEYESVMMKLTELQGSVHGLSTSILDHEREIVVLKESLSQAHEALMASRSELKDKGNELEQSEQRVSAIREKLSIAVAKGKGLIVQRDNLKQLLAQTSSELERCLQELQMKDTRLHETEAKLKTYSEAGERVEALESELSYIRNSATALRESFLLKDSVLQRIEEILDELDLPENFHSRDIIEKVDWLAKSSTGENLPQTDWDQRNSVAGGSGSDANFVITDAWKDEMQPVADVGDDLRRKYEELQTRFYGLAEQNEMLEQSLMERNNIVQRWEELLEKIDIPSHLRSIEPEDKIEWLHRSLSEACQDRDSFHQRVNYLENYCGSLTADLDDSQKKISDVEIELHSVMLEKEKLSEQNEMLEQSSTERNNLVQRWEEVLEKIDIPSHLQSIEPEDKIEWLHRSLSEAYQDRDSLHQRVNYLENSCGLLTTDLDDSQKKISDVETELHSVMLEKEKLSERNEMLEQSLTERNNLVQRWEEVLEKIDIPSHLQFLEPEDKIEWLHRSLSEAYHDRDSLHQRVNYLENSCGLLTADLDNSRKKISDIEAEFHSVMLVREKLSKKLEIIFDHNEHLSFGTFENEVENIILQNELSNMRDKLISTEHKIVKLEALVSDALGEVDTNDLVVSDSSIEFLELMVMKLVQNYTASCLGKVALRRVTNGPDTEEIIANNIDMNVAWQNDKNNLKKDLEDAVHQLMIVTKERDQYIEMHESLVVKVESLDRKKDELQELLNLEEQKSTSIREKLNVAVRKGKSLVQQRDSLKLAIEKMTAELDHLRSEMKSQENTLASYEQKLKDFSVYSGRVEAMESENLSLKNHLTETESNLMEKEHILSSIVNTLVHIEVNVDVNVNDPIEKLEQIGKLCSDLREAVVFSEQESVKSRRAAELLLAELNEVQERNDVFQEELAKASDEIAVLTKERDLAETSKLEALSELENLSTLHSKEKKNRISQFMGLKSGLERLKGALHEINYLLADAFSKDLDAFYNLKAAIASCTDANDPADVNPSPSTVSDGFKKDKGSFFALDSWLNSYTNSPVDENETEIHSFIAHHLEDLMKEIGSLKEMIDGHSVSFHKQSDSLSKVLGVLYDEVNSQKELVQTLKWNVQQSQSVANDKEMEGDILSRNIAVLFEACTSTIKEVNQRKGELMGNDLTSEKLGTDFIYTTPDQLLRSGETNLSSEETVRTIADRLLLAVREFIDLKAEMFDGSVKEMKVAISNLQKELQEKDIQKERICMELVGQIKEAEATATRYSLDFQASKDRVHELENAMEQMESEKKVLEQRLREMQDGLSISAELRERVRSLTDSLAAKDQEIEALMHALDEEEVQMEGLNNNIEELEKVLKQKNEELESIETSRGKLMKKLSITVTKFDELHHLSESLLTEVETLQSQLQDRDAEISFLRQEVTRCTNDALVATQTSNRSTEDINEVITWFDTMEARVGLSHIVHDDQQNEVHECKEVLKKKITSILKEIEDLQAVSQRKDEMLLAEKNKVEELKRKQLQLNLLEDVGDGNRASSATPEIFESEPLINNWAASSTSVTPQVRSLRKGNTDQVAIAIDMDPASSSNRFEDEDDDKVHGFKSLASSRIVPNFSRRATDMIDGLWVSCDRALMRQPVLRLGIIFYWAILHALVAAFVV